MIQSSLLMHLQNTLKKQEHEIVKVLKKGSVESKNVAIIFKNKNSGLLDDIASELFTLNRCLIIISDEKQMKATLFKDIDMLIFIINISNTVSISPKAIVKIKF